MASRVVGAVEMHFHIFDFSLHHFETLGNTRRSTDLEFMKCYCRIFDIPSPQLVVFHAFLSIYYLTLHHTSAK